MEILEFIRVMKTKIQLIFSLFVELQTKKKRNWMDDLANKRVFINRLLA
jgi:hypothetical protein